MKGFLVFSNASDAPSAPLPIIAFANLKTNRNKSTPAADPMTDAVISNIP